jgi:YegS/Rv2252/BmrU family lipid kinase
LKKDFLIIVNPKAGKGRTKKYLSRIHSQAVKSGRSFDLLLTEKRGDARNFAAENKENYKHFLVVGGDGTLNEVVNGYDEQTGVFPALGVLPLGSGNDFGKRMHGKRKIAEIMKRYFTGSYEKFHSDFCKAEIENENGERVRFRFINAVGIGFDSFVAKENLDNKIFSGLTSYVFAVLRGLKKFKGVKAIVNVDGEKIADGAPLLLVTIGNNKTSGGGFYLNPFAEIDDEKLDVTTIRHLPISGILKNLPLTLINKTEQIPNFRHKNGKEISVELIEPFIVHADGEIFSLNAKRVNVKMHDKKMELIA